MDSKRHIVNIKALLALRKHSKGIKMLLFVYSPYRKQLKLA